MSDFLEHTGWPRSRLGEALEALAVASGLSFWRDKPLVLPKPPEPAGKTLACWLEATARSLGLEAEPFTCPYAEVERSLLRAGPALVRLPGEAEPRYLALLGCRRRRLAVLTPSLEVAYLDPASVRCAVARDAEAAAVATVNPVLAALDIPARRRPRAQAALLGELLALHPIAAGWVLRSSPAAPLWVQAREFGLGRDLWRFLAGHAVYYGLWIASWWLLGAAVLHGRADLGWLLAWALLLLALIPFRVLSTYAGGALAVRAGLLLKRRLLFGALKLDPDQVRVLGSGQLLGRVLESEVLDTMALTGGFLTATALIELGIAAPILWAGAGGGAHTLTLAACLVAAAFLARRQLHCRRRWTEHRFDMTHDLVEKMIGQRTRLAQEPPDDWHAGEDEALERYHDLSRQFDRTNESLRAFSPGDGFWSGRWPLRRRSCSAIPRPCRWRSPSAACWSPTRPSAAWQMGSTA
jgi:ATP-binding cassette subfamily B protein